MAPSPTGEYHIGHVRTLLYNYAFAKQNNGKFLIRIEDTDRERYVEGSVAKILDVITDYGFTWDEGPKVGGPYAPYVQSERLEVYKKYAYDLVEKGAAYRCFCSEERLEKLREAQRKQGLPTTKYDRCCLKLSKEEVEKNVKDKKKYVIRLKVPENKIITFHDEVLGNVSINSNDLDDQVLLKTDGFPTYHLAVVVDDHLMEITHVMRGIDWLPSTPKHILLYEAFGWGLPKYIHLPNLKELGGTKKLAKRFGSVAATEFLEEGYLPEALVNFIMFLGWNPGGDREIYSLDEFIKLFSIEKIHKTDLIAFDRQKLLWLNGHYIRNIKVEELHERLEKWAKKFNVKLNSEKFPKDFNIKVLSLVQERIKVFKEFNDWTKYFYEEPKIEQEMLISFCSDGKKAKEILESFRKLYESVDKWARESLDKVSHGLLTQKSYTPKEAFMTLRIAITGEKTTPPIFDILEVLGKSESLKRLKSAQIKI